MANYLCEMFGYVYYSDILSYEALLRRENYLLGDFKLVLLEHDAVHINTIPLGDSLLFQCSFSVYDDSLFEKVCEDLHTVLCENVYCKLLFVDKSLDYMHVCSLTHLGWLESSLHFPVIPKNMLSGNLSIAKEDISLNNACKLYNSRIEVPNGYELDSEETEETVETVETVDIRLDVDAKANDKPKKSDEK